MALISCPECGVEVSDKATSCPKCGYPVQQAVQVALQQERMASSVQFTFYHTGQTFNTGCKIMDLNGYELASCYMGQTVSFRCNEPMTVRVKMGGCFGKPIVNVVPGGIYEAGINGLGAVRVQQTGRYQPPVKKESPSKKPEIKPVQNDQISRLAQQKNEDARWLDDGAGFVLCPVCHKRMSIDFIKARRSCPDCGCEYSQEHPI